MPTSLPGSPGLPSRASALRSVRQVPNAIRGCADLRGECLHHILPLNAQHLGSVLAESVSYHNQDRPRSLSEDSSAQPAVSAAGTWPLDLSSVACAMSTSEPPDADSTFAALSVEAILQDSVFSLEVFAQASAVPGIEDDPAASTCEAGHVGLRDARHRGQHQHR